MLTQAQLESLRRLVKDLYERHSTPLPFHGWHHISFVIQKSLEFSDDLGADRTLVEAAALTHDLNYLVEVNTSAAQGDTLRLRLLEEAGVDQDTSARINCIVNQASTTERTAEISPEAKALADGDNLFKVLPIGPVLLSPLYLSENKVSLEKLANFICQYQGPLFDQGIYFYSPMAKERYDRWAAANIGLWRLIKETLNDPNVQEVMRALEQLDS